jgi:hypothetical protein
MQDLSEAQGETHIVVVGLLLSMDPERGHCGSFLASQIVVSAWMEGLLALVQLCL